MLNLIVFLEGRAFFCSNNENWNEISAVYLTVARTLVLRKTFVFGYENIMIVK